METENISFIASDVIADVLTTVCGDSVIFRPFFNREEIKYFADSSADAAGASSTKNKSDAKPTQSPKRKKISLKIMEKLKNNNDGDRCGGIFPSDDEENSRNNYPTNWQRSKREKSNSQLRYSTDDNRNRKRSRSRSRSRNGNRSRSRSDCRCRHSPPPGRSRSPPPRRRRSPSPQPAAAATNHVYVCDICYDEFRRADLLCWHLYRYHKLPTCCAYCTNHFYDTEELMAHVRVAHAGVKQLECWFCDLKPLGMRLFWDHMWRCHGRSMSRCNRCGQVCFTPQCRRAHDSLCYKLKMVTFNECRAMSGRNAMIHRKKPKITSWKPLPLIRRKMARPRPPPFPPRNRYAASRTISPDRSINNRNSESSEYADVRGASSEPFWSYEPPAWASNEHGCLLTEISGGSGGQPPPPITPSPPPPPPREYFYPAATMNPLLKDPRFLKRLVSYQAAGVHETPAAANYSGRNGMSEEEKFFSDFAGVGISKLDQQSQPTNFNFAATSEMQECSASSNCGREVFPDEKFFSDFAGGRISKLEQAQPTNGNKKFNLAETAQECGANYRVRDVEEKFYGDFAGSGISKSEQSLPCSGNKKLKLAATTVGEMQDCSANIRGCEVTSDEKFSSDFTGFGFLKLEQVPSIKITNQNYRTNNKFKFATPDINRVQESGANNRGRDVMSTEKFSSDFAGGGFSKLEQAPQTNENNVENKKIKPATSAVNNDDRGKIAEKKLFIDFAGGGVLKFGPVPVNKNNVGNKKIKSATTPVQDGGVNNRDRAEISEKKLFIDFAGGRFSKSESQVPPQTNGNNVKSKIKLATSAINHAQNCDANNHDRDGVSLEKFLSQFSGSGFSKFDEQVLPINENKVGNKKIKLATITVPTVKPVLVKAVVVVKREPEGGEIEKSIKPPTLATPSEKTKQSLKINKQTLKLVNPYDSVSIAPPNVQQKSVGKNLVVKKPKDEIVENLSIKKPKQEVVENLVLKIPKSDVVELKYSMLMMPPKKRWASEYAESAASNFGQQQN